MERGCPCNFRDQGPWALSEPAAEAMRQFHTEIPTRLYFFESSRQLSPLHQGQQTFSVKGWKVNVLGFGGHIKPLPNIKKQKKAKQNLPFKYIKTILSSTAMKK